jgi:histidinol dehydrogenase
MKPNIEIPEIDLRGKKLTRAQAKKVIPRASVDVESVMGVVLPILERVKAGDESTLKDLATEFDGVTPAHIKVPIEAIKGALLQLDPEVRAALEVSIEQVRKVHADQLRQPHSTQVIPGGLVTHTWIPVDRVGLYVPGGNAVYPSSVVMNVVPAQIAGVQSIALASPPQSDHAGLPHPTILATCALLGVTEVYAVGGAQAIAMFAYGIDGLCEPVDTVTGPGNIYVAAAKRALRGIIAIDSEAGPTEIAILADDTAHPGDIASDLISQAEHDVHASAVLVTPSIELAARVRSHLQTRVAATKHSERIRQALSGQQSAIVLVDSIDQGVEVINGYAAEHLEIQVADLSGVSSKIRNAGAVFLGRFAPVSLGDYSAGSNHVLPTGGCACHSSGLSVQTFLRGVNFVEYDETAFRQLAATVITLANAEDLPAHGEAISARFEEKI